MPLWRITPFAHPGDSRWQDHPIWEEVVVRAPSAMLARFHAALMEIQREANPGSGRVGNESRSYDSALYDEKLYRVANLSTETLPDLALDGNDEVLSATLLKPGPHVAAEPR